MAEVFPSSTPPSTTLDHIIPNTPERSDVRSPLDPSPNKKDYLRPKFTAENDLIPAREVSAAKAHVAKYGKIQNLFRQVATQANLNRKLTQKFTAKRVQVRYM